MLDARDHELGDALAAADVNGSDAEIDQQHFDLAAIVGVDGAGAVQNRDPGFQGEARAWAKLGLVAWRQLEREAGGNERAGAWRQSNRRVLRHAGDNIETCGML